jgi:ADP-ribosylglycohydrolase
VYSIINTGIGFLPEKSAARVFVNRIVQAAGRYKDPYSALAGLYRLRSTVSTWYAPEALGYSYAMFALGGGDFVESVLGAVNLGRDADTIAAMAGALCGAMGGIDRIPGAWIRKCRKVKGTCIRNFQGIDIKKVARGIIALEKLKE